MSYFDNQAIKTLVRPPRQLKSYIGICRHNLYKSQREIILKQVPETRIRSIVCENLNYETISFSGNGIKLKLKRS